MKKKSSRRGADIFQYLIAFLFLATILLSLVTCLLFSGVVHATSIFAFLMLPNWVLMTIGLVIISSLLGLSWLGWHYIVRKIPAKYRWLFLIFLSIVFFVLQIFIISKYYFIEKWDNLTIFNNALAIADGQRWKVENFYYGYYPNNIFLTIIYATVIRLSKIVGIYSYYFILIVIQCLLFHVAALMLFATIKRLFKKEWLAWFGWLLCILFVGLQPWFSVPYSDASAFLFPILIVYLYTLKPIVKWKRYARWIAIALALYIGAKIKPHVAIVGIAIILYQMYIILRAKICDKQKLFTKYRVVCLAASVAVVLILNFLIGIVENRIIPVDRSKSVTIFHYFMIGMDYHSDGTYDTKYVQASRASANPPLHDFNQGKSFINEMGFDGFVALMQRKMLSNYNDGLFSWWTEFRTRICATIKQPNGRIMQFIQDVYYPPDARGCNMDVGKNYKWFQSAMQAVWLAILVLMMLSLLKSEYRSSSVLLISMLAIVGLTVYEQIFEARARYLFTYLPIYVLIATAGAYSVGSKILYLLQRKVAGKGKQ